ncbi:hypothetical protein N7492_010704 [Penicillium capsulatum]|uniref:Uncharacterized protein n=1 Tax=Penicillium capsulatum TaxID=69766 RepID=A0A9W9LF62_9EURO|nr:hypothetical protein N7492_010704 [Penicillium capsulatum]
MSRASTAPAPAPTGHHQQRRAPGDELAVSKQQRQLDNYQAPMSSQRRPINNTLPTNGPPPQKTWPPSIPAIHPHNGQCATPRS